jgi:hypothetical protein
MGALNRVRPKMTRSLSCGLVGIALQFGLPSFVASSEQSDIQQLLKQLGSDKFKEREAANAALLKVGKPALGVLQKAAMGSGDEEVRSRATKLILDIKDALIRPIDLSPHVNQKLNEHFHGHQPGNDLATLPTGTRTFSGIKFTVGEGVVQLGAGKPNRVEGIKVGKKAEKFQFLHACSHCGGTPLNSLIGKYVVRFEDKSTAEIEIVYGKDVIDWWEQPGVADPTRSKVAWDGQNKFSRIKLFLTTWSNPTPEKTIVSIDYVMIRNSPFCVAITSEE